MMKNGIDISYCNKGINLLVAKATGIDYVIIRAGISTRNDTEFKTHTANAIKNGLPYGFYWYSRAFTVSAAKKEAAACIKAIKPYDPTYPIFYDIEEQDQANKLTKTQATDIVIAFCEEIRKAGYIPAVYANPSWLETQLDKSRIVGKYDIWLAHWTNSPLKPTKYNYGQAMWQWGTTKIAGEEVDADVCYKDYAAKLATTPATPEKPTAMASAVTKGKKLTLKNVGLYASAYAKTPVRYLNGNYYIYDGVNINGFYRICPSANNVGQAPTGANVTGFVRTKDIK